MSISVGGNTYNVYSYEQINNKKSKREQIISQMKLREVGQNIYAPLSNKSIFYVWNPVTEQMELLPSGDIRGDGNYKNGSMVNNGTLQAYRQGYNFTDTNGVYEKGGELYTWDSSCKHFKKLKDNVQNNNNDETQGGLAKVLKYLSGSENNVTTTKGAVNSGSDFNSFSDLKNYIFSEMQGDLYSKYNIKINSGTSLESIAKKHENDWAKIKKNDILDELYKEYLNNDFSNAVFDSFDDLYNYVLGTCCIDYKTKYPDSLFQGGSDAGKTIAEKHKYDFDKVTRAQVLEEFHTLYVNMKNYSDAINTEGYFTSYEDLSRYLFSEAKDEFNKFYNDIEFHGGAVSAVTTVLYYYSDKLETATRADVLRDLHAQLLKYYPSDITEYTSMWGQPEALRNYLLSGAKIDFENKYPDVKFIACSQAALNVYNRHNRYGEKYTREEILEELYNEFKSCGDKTADFSDGTISGKIKNGGSLNQTFSSYNEFASYLWSDISSKSFNGFTSAGIHDFTKWGSNREFINILCEMHRFDFDKITYKDVMEDALRLYYQEMTEVPGVKEYTDNEKIEKNAYEYYNNLLDKLIEKLDTASTSQEYRDILRQLSYMPLNFSAQNSQSLDDYISNYSDTLGISKNAITSLYNNKNYTSLFQKSAYIQALCEVQINKINNNLINIPLNDILEDFHVIVNKNGSITFSDNLEFLNENNGNNDFAKNYIKALLDLVETRADRIMQYLGNNNSEISQKFEESINLIKTLSGSLNNDESTTYLISAGDEETIDNAPNETVLEYIDENFKEVIGDKADFMKLVSSFYKGASNYNYEDCAKLLAKALSSDSAGKVPDREIVAETLAQLLEIQDRDYENYKPLLETVEDIITSYLENKEGISISDFLQFCKDNKIFDSFRTEAEIQKDIEATLDSLNDLLSKQIDLVKKYNGNNPPEGTSDAQLLEEITTKIEEYQKLLNKYGAETPREKADETFKQFFITIMAKVCNTGISEENIEDLLNKGTNLSSIYNENYNNDNGNSNGNSNDSATTTFTSSTAKFAQAKTTKAATRGFTASPIASKTSKISGLVHDIVKNTSSGLGIAGKVTSMLGFGDISNFSNKWSEYTEQGSELINAYNDPKATCDTLVKWAGISTSFVSAVFSFARGDYEKGAQQGLVGIGYLASPSLGGGIQNLVNLITSLNQYNKSESDYGEDWKDLFPDKDIYQVSKMKLYYDISINVLGILGNIFTGGLFGAIQGGLMVVEQVFKTSIGGVLKQIDKFASKLGLNLNLSSLGEKIKNLKGKFWNKTILGQFLKSLLYNIFKTESKEGGATQYNVDDIIQRFNDLSITLDSSYSSSNSYTEHTLSYGFVREYPDGTKYYYEYKDGTKTGVPDLVAVEKNGIRADINVDSSISPLEMTYINNNTNHDTNVDSPISPWEMAYGSNNTNTNHTNNYFEDFIDEAANMGLYDLADKLRQWTDSGCQGDFSWTSSNAGPSSSGTPGSGRSIGSGGAGSGTQTGGYCPDGTYSPIAVSPNDWGIMSGVIGVGLHGGDIMFPSGGGYIIDRNCYLN